MEASGEPASESSRGRPARPDRKPRLAGSRTPPPKRHARAASPRRANRCSRVERYVTALVSPSITPIGNASTPSGRGTSERSVGREGWGYEERKGIDGRSRRAIAVPRNVVYGEMKVRSVLARISRSADEAYDLAPADKPTLPELPRVAREMAVVVAAVALAIEEIEPDATALAPGKVKDDSILDRDYRSAPGCGNVDGFVTAPSISWISKAIGEIALARSADGNEKAPRRVCGGDENEHEDDEGDAKQRHPHQQRAENVVLRLSRPYADHRTSPRERSLRFVRSPQNSTGSVEPGHHGTNARQGAENGCCTLREEPSAGAQREARSDEPRGWGPASLKNERARPAWADDTRGREGGAPRHSCTKCRLELRVARSSGNHAP